jgi:hypothetical protein
LREIFAKDAKDGILKMIWPKLALIKAIGSATFWPYTQRVMQYAGEPMTYVHRTYTASEGQIGLVTELNSTRYCLLPHQMFYEFIPLEDGENPDPPTLHIDQLELDKEYEIVLTNLSGLYRYRIMDVVKVVGFLNNTPQICFSYRKNQIMNMAGEKTTYTQLAKAVEECAKHFGCNFLEFAVYQDLRGDIGRYTILLESDDPAMKHRAGEVSKVMHEKLCETNPDMLFSLEEGLLGPAEVQFVQPETFTLYKEMRIMRGASKNQLKPVRLIDTPERERFFFTLLDSE